ncbi:MAG: hypothetical protein WBF53_11860 [Litorimonas sp.]
MADIRVKRISPFYHAEFLPRVFHEMCQHRRAEGEFPIGKSLSWQGFQMLASQADLASVCVQALDFREPNIRPDRRRFAAFRLSLGTRLLERDLPFTRKQLCILGESLIVQLKLENDAFPIERISALLRDRTKAV